MVDEDLLHEVADDIVGEQAPPHVLEADCVAAVAFAKATDWTPELTEAELPGVDSMMQDPRFWVGYGIILGLEAARRSA